MKEMKGLVRIEKTERANLPYQILLGDLVVALCPNEFTAMIIAGALSYKIEFERKLMEHEEANYRTVNRGLQIKYSRQQSQDKRKC